MKVYSTPTCRFCAMARELLRRMGVQFQDINVVSDKEGTREMIGKSGQSGVPVIDIQGTIIVGFDKDKIESTLQH